jgi:hypothetical protein
MYKVGIHFTTTTELLHGQKAASWKATARGGGDE